MLTPLKPKTFPLLIPASKCSPWSLMGPICSTCVHSQIHLHHMCTIYSQSVHPFDHISQGFELLTPLNPLLKCRRGVSWCELFLSYVHSQINSQTCTKFGANRSIRLPAFPDLNVWPSKTPRNAPCDIEGRIVFNYVHSQTNPQTCTKFVPIGRAVWQLPQTFEFVTP